MLVYLTLLNTDEEKEKFSTLYDTYYKQLLYVAIKMLNNQEKAEDCVHETFLRLIKHIDKIDNRVYEVLQRYHNEKQKIGEIVLTDYLEKMKQEEKTVCYKTWGYLVTILKNVIYNNIRKESKIIPIDDIGDVLPDSYLDMEEKIIKDRELLELMINIRKLPLIYQQVLMLQYFQELSASEIGEILEKSPDNIRHISKRARDNLKKLMMKGGDTNDR